MADQQLEDVLRGIVADEAARTQLQAADTVVRLALSDPDTALTLRGKGGAEVALDVGDTPFDPEVTLAMTTATATALLDGSIDLTRALAEGAIKAKGPVPKVLKLVPVLLGASGRVEPVAADAAPAADEAPAAGDEAPAAGDDEPAVAEDGTPAETGDAEVAEAQIEPESELDPPSAG